MAPDFDVFGQCPISLQPHTHIQMAHGGGGRLMHQLIEKMFLSTFGSQPEWRHDSARLTLPHGQLAFTTDSYVVSPLFFSGGDIGAMAVYGTVNDLAMAGATPAYLSLSFILEEGLPLEQLWRIVKSIQAAAELADVQIVTGDTKVVERGKADGLYINTAGVGVIEHALTITPYSVQPGDAIILSGDIGRHAIAIMAQREGLDFDTPLESDLAPVSKQVLALLKEELDIHCLRDLTRGGLATALNEIAAICQLSLQIDKHIPVHDAVRGACEILGLDPLYLANEGRFVLFLPASLSAKAVGILNQTAPCQGDATGACQIGYVTHSSSAQDQTHALVTQQTLLGGERIISLKSGEQMPRIC